VVVPRTVRDLQTRIAMRSIGMLVGLALFGGCTSTPEYLGVYQITAHNWIAEISVGSGQLACTAPGSPIDDGDPYFALVTDGDHAGAVQWVRCQEPSACTVQPDYAWFSLSGDGDRLGTNAEALVERPEFGSPRCGLFLDTFTATSPNGALHVDLNARRAYNDSIATCTADRALALASVPTCIWVEHLTGEPMD